MAARADRWTALYSEAPLCEVPYHFANTRNSPFTLDYFDTVLRHCPPGARTLETGVGSGFGAIWLSLRGCKAEGIDYSAAIVERARQVNGILGGSARFRCGDLFQLYEEG